MQLSSLELALRAGTVALLLVLAASLYGEFRKVLAGRLAQDPCCINEIDVDDGRIPIRRINDTSHLDDIESP